MQRNVNVVGLLKVRHWPVARQRGRKLKSGEQQNRRLLSLNKQKKRRMIL